MGCKKYVAAYDGGFLPFCGIRRNLRIRHRRTLRTFGGLGGGAMRAARLSTPVNIFHPYRMPLLQIALGFLQVGAFGRSDFRKIRIPCKDKTPQEFV